MICESGGRGFRRGRAQFKAVAAENVVPAGASHPQRARLLIDARRAQRAALIASAP